MLPHVDAVRAHRQRNIHVVVDDKGNAVLAAEGLQLPGFLEEVRIVQILLPQLQESGAAFQRLFHLARKRPAAQPAAVRDRA